MRKITFIIIFILSIITLIFVYNDDFIYKDQIMKITKIETVDEYELQNTLGLREKYYTKKFTGVITNGKNKGKIKKVEYEETYSSVVTDKYRVGDKIILSGNDINLKRDFYLVLMFVVFINLIYLVGSFKGLLSILSVIFNIIIFYIGLFLYSKGINLLFLTVVEMIIFSIVSLILASGVNKKTFSAVISVIVSTLIMLTLLLIVINIKKKSETEFKI